MFLEPSSSLIEDLNDAEVWEQSPSPQPSFDESQTFFENLLNDEIDDTIPTSQLAHSGLLEEIVTDTIPTAELPLPAAETPQEAQFIFVEQLQALFEAPTSETASSDETEPTAMQTSHEPAEAQSTDESANKNSNIEPLNSQFANHIPEVEIPFTPVFLPEQQNETQDKIAQEREQNEDEIDTWRPENTKSISPRLLVVSPFTNEASEFLLISDETTIGRAGASNLLLDFDNLTSRHHAYIQRAGQSFRIFDKRSHNGVYVNGQTVDSEHGFELADGDHISIGNYELIFRYVPLKSVTPQLI